MPSLLDSLDESYVNTTARSVFESLDETAPEDYRALTAILVTYWKEHGCRSIGLGGGQGAGKSTLSVLIEQAGRALGEQIVVLHLDDFYLTKDERRRLAQSTHPLFETRGPPGTHDVECLLHSVRALQSNRSVEVPVFDKSKDDRVRSVKLGPHCDRILLEGWCVGAQAQSEEDLVKPINGVEREHDPAGVWRRHVNTQLRDSYQRLFGLLDFLVYLRVPSMSAVVRWRLQQETSFAEELRRDQTWVERFVQHYQRITESMARDADDRANAVVSLGEQHEITNLEFPSRASPSVPRP